MHPQIETRNADEEREHERGGPCPTLANPACHYSPYDDRILCVTRGYAKGCLNGHGMHIRADPIGTGRGEQKFEHGIYGVTRNKEHSHANPNLSIDTPIEKRQHEEEEVLRPQKCEESHGHFEPRA
jgi:hypothetical protein